MKRLIALSLLALAPAFAFAAPHPFNAHDLVMMDRVSDPHLSPDASRVAFHTVFQSVPVVIGTFLARAYVRTYVASIKPINNAGKMPARNKTVTACCATTP